MTGREKDPWPIPAEEGEEGGFLSRWSRRKVEAKSVNQEPADVEPESTGDSTPEPASADEPSGLDVADLPDIDSLGPGSDFSVFMQAGVPPALKTKALRKLWRVKPELANLDGLLDYGEDLTGSFKVADHLKTAYEVGRGFLRHDEEDEQVDQQKTAGQKEPGDDGHSDGDGHDMAETEVSDPPAGESDVAATGSENIDKQKS